MRTIFLGTPEFAVPSLRALAAAGHELVAVFTQPDRPKGRGGQLASSPVKLAALDLGLPVHQPERIRRPEPVDSLRQMAPDLMVVVGYGQIIPQTIINIPPRGILNVHASLLPKYRGAAPVQWAIADGESETGVTIMQIDAGLDTGDMLTKRSVTIGPDEGAPELSARLAEVGAALLMETIDAIASGRAAPERQNEADATLAPILKKEDGLVNWSRSASEIYNRFRGFSPWPGAYTTFRGQMLTLTSLRPVSLPSLAPGSLHVEKRSLIAGCGGGTAVELLEVQPAGKKRMAASAFVNGYGPKSMETLN